MLCLITVPNGKCLLYSLSILYLSLFDLRSFLAFSNLIPLVLGTTEGFCPLLTISPILLPISASVPFGTSWLITAPFFTMSENSSLIFTKSLYSLALCSASSCERFSKSGTSIVCISSSGFSITSLPLLTATSITVPCFVSSPSLRLCDIICPLSAVSEYFSSTIFKTIPSALSVSSAFSTDIPSRFGTFAEGSLPESATIPIIAAAIITTAPGIINFKAGLNALFCCISCELVLLKGISFFSAAPDITWLLFSLLLIRLLPLISILWLFGLISSIPAAAAALAMVSCAGMFLALETLPAAETLPACETPPCVPPLNR